MKQDDMLMGQFRASTSAWRDQDSGKVLVNTNIDHSS